MSILNAKPTKYHIHTQPYAGMYHQVSSYRYTVVIRKTSCWIARRTCYNVPCTPSQPHSITPQHTLNQIAQGAPEVLPAGEVVLVDEEHVLLEAGVEMGLEAQLADDGVVVAVDVGVDAVHALEDLADQSWKRLGEGHADA
jgi:hypothetical protein